MGVSFGELEAEKPSNIVTQPLLKQQLPNPKQCERDQPLVAWLMWTSGDAWLPPGESTTEYLQPEGDRGTGVIEDTGYGRGGV